MHNEEDTLWLSGKKTFLIIEEILLLLPDMLEQVLTFDRALAAIIPVAFAIYLVQVPDTQPGHYSDYGKLPQSIYIDTLKVAEKNKKTFTQIITVLTSHQKTFF